MAQSVVQMEDCLMIKMEDGFIETARPDIFENGAIILDGDEDSQVVVYEDGQVTDWALQLLKWRLFFHVPDDRPADFGLETGNVVEKTKSFSCMCWHCGFSTLRSTLECLHPFGIATSS